MLDGYLYHTIYLAVISVMTLIVYFRYHDRTNEKELAETNSFPFQSALLIVALIIFLGTRPVDKSFVDMTTYDDIFYYLKYSRPVFHWNWDELNIIYDNFFAWSATFFETPMPLFVIIAVIYFGCIFIACRRMFPGNTLASLITYLAAFSTFSYGTNGMKAGMAASIFLVAISYYNKPWLMISIALISYGFHHSMQLCVGALLLTVIYKKPKVYFFVWGFSLLIAILHITIFQEFFSGLTDEHGEGYLSQIVLQEEKAWGGFRIDFIIYSFIPIAMGLYAKTVKKFESGFYDYILSLYLVTNSIWLLCIYANFTNRIAYLSWFMLPIVLIYPVLHPNWGEKRFRDFSFIMLAHLSFTLFMQLIYYA